MRESMFCRFATDVSAALIALSFTAGAVAYSAPSELKTTVVIYSASSARPNISIPVRNNGNTDESKCEGKPTPIDLHFIKKMDKSSP